MNFDRKSIERLISLNDAELSKLRAFLSLASADDITRLISGLGGNKNV